MVSLTVTLGTPTSRGSQLRHAEGQSRPATGSAPAQSSSLNSSVPVAVLDCEEEETQRKVGVWVGKRMWSKVVFDCNFAWSGSLLSKTMSL